MTNLSIKPTKKALMYEKIHQHGENLNKMFNTGIDTVALCKKLHRLEIKANHAATCLLNTNTLNLIELNRYTRYDVKQATEEEIETFFNIILNSVYKILGDKAKDAVFINYDARGYTLKIRTEFIKSGNYEIYQDWGGYGILAPDFN